MRFFGRTAMRVFCDAHDGQLEKPTGGSSGPINNTKKPPKYLIYLTPPQPNLTGKLS